ncbi:YigZ family protein [Suicoccus acidiformans]|uniref:YigZ family protein n=1 Tax=Suicoccus acidiformans TaxID=2036206 RepID=A0A347WNC8_9LACT|nr:YigZ family protein [Suicoccus acidiformans]AXY26585.1 YigZ family protein [Suicoccus acidiformans]
MANYYSIQDPILHEIEIKKSRFLTYLIPIQSEAEFQEHLASIRKEHYKATHHCQAYILEEDSSVQRMSDDGEPSGTAGMPMLEVLRQNELTYIMAVVVRYFGGIKLGAGGLIRAYSTAVSEALGEAQMIQNVSQMLVHVTVEYNQVDRFNYQLEQGSLPVTLMDTVYTDKVQYQLAIGLDVLEDVHKQLTELFNAQFVWDELGEQTVNVPREV